MKLAFLFIGATLFSNPVIAQTGTDNSLQLCLDMAHSQRLASEVSCGRFPLFSTANTQCKLMATQKEAAESARCNALYHH